MYSNGGIYIPNRKPPMGAVLNPYLPINQVLAAHWLFNEGSGDTVEDLSVNNNTGIFQGTAPSWGLGNYGSCLVLPGSDEYVDCGIGPSLFPAAVTVSVWVKRSGEQANFSGIVSGPGQSAAVPGYMIIFLSTERALMYVRDGSNWRESQSNIAIPDETWTHLVGTYSIAQGKVFLYVNAVLQADQHPMTGAITYGDSDTPARIGQYSATEMAGLIDNVTIWGRVLNQSEIDLILREPFCGFRWTNIVQLAAVVAGGVVYQELNLTVTANASAAKTDAQQMVDTGKAVQAEAAATESDTQQIVETGKAVQADAAATESDTQQMIDTGKEVSADASVSKTDTQQMLETGKAVEAAASVYCTEIKVVFELNLTVTAAGSVVATDAHTMIETGKSVTAVASPAVIDTQAMVETGLGVSADASVSCIDTMGLLAHIAAFMILRQCTS